MSKVKHVRLRKKLKDYGFRDDYVDMVIDFYTR